MLKILIVGVSYKYGVSDLRNSLNLEIFQTIYKKFKNIKVFDPFVKLNPKIQVKKKLDNFKIYIFLSKERNIKNYLII